MGTGRLGRCTLPSLNLSLSLSQKNLGEVIQMILPRTVLTEIFFVKHSTVLEIDTGNTPPKNLPVGWTCPPLVIGLQGETILYHVGC
jgi:hypothetical protein